MRVDTVRTYTRYGCVVLACEHGVRFDMRSHVSFPTIIRRGILSDQTMDTDAFDRRQVARAFGGVRRSAPTRKGPSLSALCDAAIMDYT